MAALVEHTGARGVFELSAGAVPVLRWALTAPRDHRIALYEPPLRVSTFSPAAWLPRYERELAQGRSAAAMATVARGNSPWLRFVLRTALVPFLRLGLRAQAEQIRQAGVGVPLRALLPTMSADARMVRESTGLAEAASTVRARVLLLGGSRSARYLREARGALEDSLPRSGRVEFGGLGHLAANNDGRPERVAAALAGFFAPLVSRSARS